jgi:hypothetical protein
MSIYDAIKLDSLMRGCGQAVMPHKHKLGYAIEFIGVKMNEYYGRESRTEFICTFRVGVDLLKVGFCYGMDCSSDSFEEDNITEKCVSELKEWRNA